MFGSFLTVFCLKMGTKQNKHSYSAVESKHYTVTGVKTPVTPVRVELHSLGLGVSVSPLIALVSVELHS